MAVHYIGDDAVVVYKATDISGYYRTGEVSETAPAADEIDQSHKGDSARTLLEGLAGPAKTNFTMTVIDIYDALTEYGTLALNSKDTITIYPNGVTHTYPQYTMNNARLNERTSSIPYDGAVEITLAFEAKNTLTRSTYSSSA